LTALIARKYLSTPIPIQVTINQLFRLFVISIAFFSSVLSGFSGRSQPVSFTKTPALGINMAFFDFDGAHKLSSFGRSMKPGLSLHFQNNLSSRFDYSIMLAGSFLEFPGNKNVNVSADKKQLLLENDLTLRARLLRSPALFNPYAQAGAGWSQYNNRYGLYVPVGLGVQVNVSQELFLLVNSQYRFAVTASQKPHFFHSIGIAGAISRKKITRAIPAPIPVPVVKQDFTADTDGDGITDNLDSCPQTAGVIRYHGCPAPVDSSDRLKAGGSRSSLEALKTIVDRAARQIFFETGSSRLLPRSFSSLDTVAHILKEDQALQIAIEGHTDDIGTAQDNQLLSENRAKAVLEYLIKAGVEASRLQAAGYGQQRPIASNTIPEGRAINRRVVLQIHY
jgi:OOP family OmpA-OmpF porin